MPLVPARGSLVSVAILMAGCGASVPIGVGPVDGGPAGLRLQPWQLVPEGAAPVLLGINDTVEGQRCAFLADSEGRLRCLPPPPPTLWSASEFADASCTKPLYRVRLADPAAFTGRPLALPIIPRAYCGAQLHVVAIVRQVPDEAPRYQSAPTGACGETPPSRSPDEIGIVVDQVVAPTRYVEGTLVDGALVDQRVRAREIVTADGARFADHLVDQRWGKRCTLRASEGDATTCTVEELRETSFFRDATCTQGELARAEPCADPAYMRAETGAFALGFDWQADVFERTKGCHLARGATRGFRPTLPTFYQRGARLDGEVVAPATWKAEGAMRLATRGLRASDGRLFVLSDAVRGQDTPAFHDRVTGEDCRAIATPDGGVRCLPSRVRAAQSLGPLYADAACTKPAYYCEAGDCDGFEFIAGDPVTFAAASATSPATHLAVAVAVPSGSIYTNLLGPCVASESTTLYTAGADVPWDKYPRVPVTGAPAR